MYRLITTLILLTPILGFSQTYRQTHINATNEFSLNFINPAYTHKSKFDNQIAIISSLRNSRDTEKGLDGAFSLINNNGIYLGHNFENNSLGVHINKYSYRFRLAVGTYIYDSIEYKVYGETRKSDILDISPKYNFKITINDSSYLRIGTQLNFITAQNFDDNINGSITMSAVSLGILYSNRNFNSGLSYKYIRRPSAQFNLEKEVHFHVSYKFNFNKFSLIESVHFQIPGINTLINTDLKHQSGILIGVGIFRGALNNFATDIQLIPKIGFERNRYSIQVIGRTKNYSSIRSTHYDISISANF